MSETDWAKLLRSEFPELASRRLNHVRWAEIEPHREVVKFLLETTTVTTIHQRLWDEGKLKVSLSTFRRWVHENLPNEAARLDQHAWTLAHAEAFRFFGGIPKPLVPDNLKTGVDKPDL